MRRLQGFLQRMRSDEGGAVAVEFALIAPLLFALMFGTICFGYFFLLAHSVQQLAAEAARASVYGITDAERQTLAADYLQNSGSRFPVLDQQALQGTVDVLGGAAPSITVAVEYDLSSSILTIANGFLGLDLSSLSVSAYVAY